MSKKIKQPNNQEVPAINKDAKIKWDDLLQMYNDIAAIIKSSVKTLETAGGTFKDLIENDKQLALEFNGISATLENLSHELVNILNHHSKKETNEDGSVRYLPYTGLVNLDDDNQQQLYITIVLAYNGLYDKIESVVNISLTHYMGLINEKSGRDSISDKNMVKTILDNSKTDK